MARQAWALLGFSLDWSGIPLVAEMLGITDIELLVWHLVLLREFEPYHG
jgi:hypothetical protein